jgi:hypothetical protein
MINRLSNQVFTQLTNHMNKWTADRPVHSNQTPSTPIQINLIQSYPVQYIFSLGATAPIWALSYLHETLRFTSVF